MNKTANKTALIIGGGIAGPTAAMALQRAGITATVFEAYPESAPNAGAFLTIAVNGIAALRMIGLDRTVMDAGFPSANIRLLSGTGKFLGEVPTGGTLTDGTVAYTIRRPDLYGLLYQEARRRGIRFEHSKRLVDAELTPVGGVVARFEDGSTAAGDLLIGADGIHSRTRRIIDPKAPLPRLSGLGNVGGYSNAVAPAVPPGKYILSFGTRAFFGYIVSPAGEVWWFANPPQAEATPPDQARLIELFEGDAGPAVDIIRHTGALLTTNQYDLAPVRRWSRGSMIVIGDAAHAASPTSGQGASLAIEDAMVLAQCLRDMGEPAGAFAAFERLRRPRVERVVSWAARMSRRKMPGRFGRGIRDAVLPIILKRFAHQSQEWLFNYQIDWDQRVDEQARAA